MQAVKDASPLYEVERRAIHAERPGFRISELQIGPKQKVPWHTHTNVQDTFYVLTGKLRIFLQDPKEEVQLGPGETCSVAPKRPHLVTNAGERSATFLVLQASGNTISCRSPEDASTCGRGRPSRRLALYTARFPPACDCVGPRRLAELPLGDDGQLSVAGCSSGVVGTSLCAPPSLGD